VISFAALKKQYFNSRQQKTVAVFTGILVLILITPFCGFLFDCGCTWPWSGLDSKCNFYKQNTIHKCPWCASWITGWLSVGVSIASGMFVAVRGSTPKPPKILPRCWIMILKVKIDLFSRVQTWVLSLKLFFAIKIYNLIVSYLVFMFIKMITF